MINSSLFSVLDKICRHVRNEEKQPFGGLIIVAVGDFFQLPPVQGDYPLHRILKSKIIPKRWLRADGSITELSDESNEDSPQKLYSGILAYQLKVGKNQQSNSEVNQYNSIMNKGFSFQSIFC